MWAWTWRLRLTRRGRLQARNKALRKALYEAEVLARVWRMSAEHHTANPTPPPPPRKPRRTRHRH